jgi:hypothetical protein
MSIHPVLIDGILTVLGTSDLECDGELRWIDVKPLETVTGEFTVSNVGDSGSLLDWAIIDYPNWGYWTFTPEYGYDLTPEDSPITIKVEVEAPNGIGLYCSGNITVVNCENNSDRCLIPATLTTPRSKQSTTSLFLQFLEKLMERYPILEKFINS